MHLWDRAVLPKTPAANQGNHLQAKFAMGQSPASFFLRSIGHVIAWTIWLDAATHDNGEFPETIQPGHRTMGVIAHPQGLPTLLTPLFQWGQGQRVRRFCT